MFDRFEFWKEKGMKPTVIYDIGAHRGDWARQTKKIFPDATLFAFEANDEHKEDLKDVSANIVLLGDKNKEAVAFYKNTIGCTTGNSIYCEQTFYFTPQTAVIHPLPMITLDSFVQANTLPRPDFMKLDVQGAELDVLKGAESIFSTLKYLVLEVSLHKYNHDAPLIEDIILYLKARDFLVVDFLEFHRVNGYLAQVDILFAHSSAGLRKEHFYDGQLKFE